MVKKLELSAPWGEESFQRDRHWYRHLGWRESFSNDKQEYAERRQRALEDPTFDLFDGFMPTGRPKHDIGRYVMRHAVNVPLINSMPEWQMAMAEGRAMLRSELLQDYTGQSGLLSSHVLGLMTEYPRGEDGYVEFRDSGAREVEGPPNAWPTVGYSLADQWGMSRYEASLSHQMSKEIDTVLTNGLYDGILNPARVLELTNWFDDTLQLAKSAAAWRYELPLGHLNILYAQASRWRHIPGANLKVMRDPVVEGRYHVGVTGSHHYIWRLENGRDSGDMYGYYFKGDHFPVFHGGENKKASADPEFRLPTDRIVDLYEKIRALPYFDTTQAPLMELQYGDDDQLYFLQYLKTGRTVGDAGEFALPSGDNIVTVHDVSGATSQEGEKVRIYLDPPVFTKSMESQGFFMNDHLEDGPQVQVASIMARVSIQDYHLSFKDNHFSSAPLVRSPVAIGLWDGVGEGETQFSRIAGERFRPRQRDENVRYINAIVTSNGRAATIDSDWDVQTEVVN